MNLQQHNISDNNFEQCIKCTICTVYCPVAAVNPNYPGPKQAGPDGERLRLKKFNFYDESLKYCINCKRCFSNSFKRSQICNDRHSFQSRIYDWSVH